MLTGRQIREARKLVRLSLKNLSRSTGLPQSLLQAIESTDGAAWLTPEQETDLRSLLEKGGIDFMPDGNARLRKAEI